MKKSPNSHVQTIQRDSKESQMQCILLITGNMNFLQLRMSSLLSLSSLEILYLTPCHMSLMDCRTVRGGGRGLQKKEALRRGLF